jgi:hypothetical protein
MASPTGSAGAPHDRHRPVIVIIAGVVIRAGVFVGHGETDKITDQYAVTGTGQRQTDGRTVVAHRLVNDPSRLRRLVP